LIVLTPAERRVAMLLVGLLALGALTDRLGGRLASPAPRADSIDVAQPSPAPILPAGGRAEATPEPVDLNRASARELDALPGVGPVLAARIIEHRSRHGAFRAIEDLRAVRGIGPRLFARLEPLIRVGPAPPSPPFARPDGDSVRVLRTAP
jgi:competence protein ComEA